MKNYLPFIFTRSRTDLTSASLFYTNFIYQSLIPMKSLLLSVMILLWVNPLRAQQKTMKDPAAYFPEKRAKVLVVGMFHTDYPNMDAYKVTDKDKIDVLTEPKKTEVTELVNYIKRFKPNKIAVEAFDNWKATEKLRAYQQGAYRTERDERFQVAMRIAADLKLDTLYGLDATTLSDDWERKDSVYTQHLFKDFDFSNEDKYNAMVGNWMNYDNQMVGQVNLLHYIRYLNSKAYHRLGYGAYLIGDFKLDDNRGADILSIWWYNRNLRIFRKLQQITEGPEDRILFVIGNGHACILRQLLECSPEYEFVEFDSLKK